MACSKQSAKDYIANARVHLIGELRNLSVILENLHQQQVFTDEEVNTIKAEKDDYDGTRAILDSVTRKGEAACYRFLRVIDQTRRRTLERPDPLFKNSHEASSEATKFDLHHWISCFSFTEDPEIDRNYTQESRPCYRYQAKLKSKAEKVSKDFWKRSENLFAENKKPELLYASLILDIQGKNFPTKIKRFKREMFRPKKLSTCSPKRKPDISPSDLLKTDKNILLFGKPGIGKTALSYEILRLWSERDNKELDYMFYFDMRELTNVPPTMSLEDLLFTACCEPDKGKEEVLQDIKCNSDNVTVILDGVTDSSSSIVKNLVEKDFLPDAKIIITCRPEDGKDICPEDWLRVEVKGFSEETIKTYLSSTLGENHRKILRNMELLTLCHVPMYALMVAASFPSKESLQPRTVSEIYIIIVRFCLQLNSNKTRIKNLNQFIKTKRNGILSLAEAAFNATEKKTVNLGELSCEDGCILSFLKILDVKVAPTESTTLYAFLHYLMQDFFAALWLLKNPDKIREVFQQCLTEEKKHMKHLIPFMCRLLNEKSPRLMSCLIPAEELQETSGWFFKEMIDTFFHQAVANISELHVDTLFVYQCLFESQSSEICISFLDKLDYHLDLSRANLDSYSCCAVAYVVTQSKDRKISLNLQDLTVTAQGMRHLFGCLQNVEWYDTLKQQLWKVFLLSEEQMDYQTLLGLSGNLLYLPVVGKNKLFDRAVKVLQTIATKVNVCLYGDRKDPLCPILRDSLLKTLPCISSLRMTYRSAGSMNQEECNNTMEKDQKNMFLDLCFTTALHSKQKFHSVMPELVTICQIKTDLVNTLVDLHQRASSKGLSTDFPTLRPVFQSTPADWLIDLSERKASTLLEMLKLQSEKKKVQLTGWSHDESEMRNLLQCLPYLSKLSFVTGPSSENIWFLEKLIRAAAEMKEQTGVNMLDLLSVCTYKGTPLHWKWCDFLLDLYSSKTETGLMFSSFLSVLQSVDPAIWFVNLSKTKASMLLDVLKLQLGKKQVNLTGWSHEEAEVRSFLQCLPYISQLSVVPLWSSSVEQTIFLTRLFCAAAEREKQTGEKILELLGSVCRYKHFPFNNRFIDETCRRNFLLDLYSQMRDCETETGLSLLPSIQSVFQSAPEIWILDLSKIKTSILLEVLKVQTEKKQVKVTGWSYEEREVRNLLMCLPYISKFRFVPESSKLHEQTSFLVTLYCAAAEREQQTGEKMLEMLASVCTFKIIPVSDIDMNEQAQKAFLLSLYGQVMDCEMKTGLSLFPLLKSVFQSVANVWITDLSERNTLMLRELMIQSEKKQVVLKGCSHEEGEVKSFLECLPFFSQLSFEPWVSEASEEIRFLWSLFCAAAEKDRQKEMKTLDMLASIYIYKEAPLKQKWSEFLLELFSYELKTGLSVLPLQRANVILFKVLKLKSSRIQGPRIASGSSDLHEQRRFLVNLFCEAAEREKQTGEKMVDMLAPLCRCKTFPFKAGDKYRLDFLLDLYMQVKDRETKTGRSLVPSLQSVFQSAPKLWTIKLSEKKTSDFMEVMKLQAEKKRVKLTDCSHEESEVGSFLQCLPFISQLSFNLDDWDDSSYDPDKQSRFLVNLFCAAAEREQQTGEKMLECFASVCRYKTFPFDDIHADDEDRSDFLLDLYSQMKDREFKAGLSLLPSLQSVFQSAPKAWFINLSKRKTSDFLEVMKLQPEKKPVILTDWSHEESEVRSFLQCLPFISQLGLDDDEGHSCDPDEQTGFLVNLFCAAAEMEQQTGEKILDMLASVCKFETFSFQNEKTDNDGDAIRDRLDFLLDLFSYVKKCETKSGLSLLPSLQSVFQSAPKVWTINLCKRKTSILLEVMKLQPEKKPVILTDCSHKESEVRSFLQCLPFISQLRFDFQSSDLHEQTRFLVNLFSAAAEREQQTGEKMVEMLALVCRYETFPLCYSSKYQSDFLLDLYSQMKDRETKSGLSLLSSLKSVFQSAPKVWTIKLSERKTSILLEVMKLQPEKKPVILTDCSHEESEVRSFLQCLPFISQLSFDRRCSDLHEGTRLLVNLFCAAAEREQQTGKKMLEMLASVCRFKTFPFDDRCMANFEYGYRKSQSDFLLDLYSQMKDRETETGLSLLPSLQSVFQSAPEIWTIKLSERKTSILLEVMKLQPVMLTDCPHEESEVRSFLKLLPFISQLRCMPRFFQSVCSSLSMRSREEIQQMVSLLQLLNFKLFLTGELSDKTCGSVGKVLPLCGFKVDLILTDSRMSVRGAAVLFRSTTHLHSLRLSNSVTLFLSQWVRRGRVACPLVLEELSVVSTKAQPQRVLLKVGSSLASLLRIWTVGRLDLTESGLPAQSLFSLLLHDAPLTLRLSEERLQQLLVLLHEVQDQDRTLSLLNKVGGDLSSCTLNWELLHYLLQQPTPQSITVNLKKNRFLEERAAQLLPFLHRMEIQRPSPSFVRTSIREIFRTHHSHLIPGLLRSLDHVINLNCTELDSEDCDALLFILRHSDGVKLKLLWSSIPAEGIQSILSMLHTVSALSVDRNLLLRFIHCCASPDSQQGAASDLLWTLQHRLDLSCSSCVQLPEEDQTEPLSVTTADCRAVSTVLRHSSRDTQLDLRDCEVEDSGLDLLFSVLGTVRLRVSKTVLVQLLSLLAVNNQRDAVRRTMSLCRALGGELDLSHCPLDQRLCGALVLMLDYSEGLTKLDLSHCQLTDQLLLQLIRHLHKVHNLDLSHNQITDASTAELLHLVSINPSIGSVRLFSSNKINKTLFKDNMKFEFS